MYYSQNHPTYIKICQRCHKCLPWRSSDVHHGHWRATGCFTTNDPGEGARCICHCTSVECFWTTIECKCLRLGESTLELSWGCWKWFNLQAFLPETKSFKKWSMLNHLSTEVQLVMQLQPTGLPIYSNSTYRHYKYPFQFRKLESLKGCIQKKPPCSCRLYTWHIIIDMFFSLLYHFGHPKMRPSSWWPFLRSTGPCVCWWSNPWLVSSLVLVETRSLDGSSEIHFDWNL